MLFGKRCKAFDFTYSFNYGFWIAIKMVFYVCLKVLCVCLSFGVGIRIYHTNKWLMLLDKCLAMSGKSVWWNHYLKLKAKICILVWYRRVNAQKKSKEMWKNVGVNITIQQKKLSQQDTCLVTSVTCLVGKFWCLLQKTNGHVRTFKGF